MIKIDFDNLKERDFKSRKRKIRLLTQELNKLVRTGLYRALSVTLTFKDFENYLEFQREGGIRRILNVVASHIKHEYDRRDFFYLWVLEVQKRGVPHFHVLLIVPRCVRIPFLDRWIFTYGLTNIKELKKFGFRYLLKYLEKDNYQQDYDSLRKKLKELCLRVRTYGYSLKLLHESLRFLMNSRSYIKWFISKVQGLKIESVYDIVKGGLVFYYYKIKDSQVDDLFNYAYKEFDHIKKLYLSFYDFFYI
ncbi:MAG: rolling circle replication-associated protein [Minisyncoccia bacterium]